MHSFINSIPVLILLAVSATSTPILVDIPCVIEGITVADPCLTLKNGDVQCPETIARSVFDRMLKNCCETQQHRQINDPAGRARINNDIDGKVTFGGDDSEALSGRISLPDNDRNDALRNAPNFYYGSVNPDADIVANVNANMHGDDDATDQAVHFDNSFNPVANKRTRGRNHREGVNGNGSGIHADVQGDADVAISGVAAQSSDRLERYKSHAENSRGAQDSNGLRLSVSGSPVSSNDGQADVSIQSNKPNRQTDNSDRSRGGPGDLEDKEGLAGAVNECHIKAVAGNN